MVHDIPLHRLMILLMSWFSTSVMSPVIAVIVVITNSMRSSQQYESTDCNLSDRKEGGLTGIILQKGPPGTWINHLYH